MSESRNRSRQIDRRTNRQGESVGEPIKMEAPPDHSSILGSICCVLTSQLYYSSSKQFLLCRICCNEPPTLKGFATAAELAPHMQISQRTARGIAGPDKVPN